MSLFSAKVLAQLALPLGLIMLLLFIAAIQAWRERWSGGPLTAVAIGILWVCSMPITAQQLATLMESGTPPLPVDQYPQADAIVVLGGAVTLRPAAEPTLELHEGADREFVASQLYHAGKAQTVICTGGTMPWRTGDVAEALAMGRLLQALGVPEKALLLESHSANTRQNALNTQALMEQHQIKRVLLVTSAMHMPRAVATFAKLGIEVVAVPSDFQSDPMFNDNLLAYLPDAEALALTTKVARETIGLWYYRLRDWA